MAPTLHRLMTTQIPWDQPPWRCMAAFKDQDYVRCVEEARRSLSSGVKPVEIFLMLVALGRLGRQQEAQELAPQFIDALADVPWEQTVIRLIMGQLPVAQALAQARTPVERCQANFYGATRAINEGHFDEAREMLLAAIKDFPECYEFMLAPLEHERLPPDSRSAADTPPPKPPAAEKPWWKFW